MSERCDRRGQVLLLRLGLVSSKSLLTEDHVVQRVEATRCLLVTHYIMSTPSREGEGLIHSSAQRQNVVSLKVALVPLDVVTETWYVIPDFIWLVAHATSDVAVLLLPPSNDPVYEKTTLLEPGGMKFTEVASVNWAPVISISLDDVHNEVVDAVAVTLVTDGTGGSNAQLTTENVVPHVELPSGEQLDAAIVLGKSLKSTTAWRMGFA